MAQSLLQVLALHSAAQCRAKVQSRGQMGVQSPPLCCETVCTP